MIKIISALWLIMLLTLSGFKYHAQNAEWSIVSSKVTFKIKNAGFTVDGKFGVVAGKIIFDGDKIDNNSIEANIDSKSINTGNDSRDGHLKKKEYFDVETFSKINMKATSFSKENNGTYKGNFKLTLKGKTKDVIIPFSFNETNSKGVFKGTFTIDRLDYGVGESSMILSDNVTISMEVNTIKK